MHGPQAPSWCAATPLHLPGMGRFAAAPVWPRHKSCIGVDVGGPHLHCAYGYYDYAPYSCAPHGFYMARLLSTTESSSASVPGATGATATAGAAIASPATAEATTTAAEAVLPRQQLPRERWPLQQRRWTPQAVAAIPRAVVVAPSITLRTPLPGTQPSGEPQLGVGIAPAVVHLRICSPHPNR